MREQSRANTQRLTNLILLIAIAYTNRALKGKKLKQNKHQKYIVRPEEKGRKSRRHSDFRVGLYGQDWVENYDYYFDEVTEIMELNQNKLKFYRKGLLALSKIREIYDLPLIT